MIALVLAVASASVACSILFPTDDLASQPADSGLDVGDVATDGCASPLIACDGACVDPRSDTNHCGACDVQCVSTKCSARVCIPFVSDPKPLNGGDVPVGIAYDGTYVYWILSAKGTLERSNLYRLRPADVKNLVSDASTPDRINLGNVTATHMDMTASAEIVFSYDDLAPAGDAGATSGVRVLTFDGGAAKTIATYGATGVIGGLVVGAGAPGTNLVWTIDGANVGVHWAAVGGGSGTELDSGLISLNSAGQPLTHVGPATRIADSGVYFAAEGVDASLVAALPRGLEGNFGVGASSAVSASFIHGITRFGNGLAWTTRNQIWQTGAGLNTVTLVDTFGLGLHAISAEGSDIFVLDWTSDQSQSARLLRRRKGVFSKLADVNTLGEGAVLATPEWLFWISDARLYFLAR